MRHRGSESSSNPILNAVVAVFRPVALGSGCSSQVPCGTQNDPLRAAVFRP